MNKAFTLIELLGVIILLAIVALITTPIIIKVLQDSREQADLTSVNSLVTAVKNYTTALEADDEETEFYIGYDTKKYTLLFKSGKDPENVEFKKFIYDNNSPDKGGLYNCENGNIELKLWYDKEKICIIKDIDNKKISIDRDITKEECFISSDNVECDK